MNKEEKDLIQCDLVLTYIKNKDYSTYYRRKTDSMVIDNEILDNEDNLYLTTLDKYNKLQQENKQLKDNWNKLKEMLPNVSKHYKNQFQLFSANCCEHILEIMQELENGDGNEDS